MTPELPTMTILYVILISVAIIATGIILFFLSRAHEEEEKLNKTKSHFER